MNSNFRNFLVWVGILFLLLALFQMFSGTTGTQRPSELSYDRLKQHIDSGDVSEATIRGNEITGKLNDDTLFVAQLPELNEIGDRLVDKGAKVTFSDESSNRLLSILLSSWLPILVIIGVWFFLIRQMQGGGKGGAMGFGRSRAKLLTESAGRVTFEDVAGVEEAKEDLEEIVEFLQDPSKFQRLGGRIPKGVLLVGPPGTGKTLLARSVAGEAGVPFFTISGSDFVEMFVGVGASRVRDMFEQAKKNAPCIIFIDEIDAVGRHRGSGHGNGNDEREQTLNQLLVEMDGFEPNESIILIAATNRPDVLDPALLRPGRFDREVNVGLPDITGREKILKVHVRKVPLAPNVDLKTVARGTPGFSGAELMNLVNEAALMAARRNKRFVTALEFDDARDKVMMGAERRTLVMTEEEKRNTAYHEAGHALIGLKLEGLHPIHKATIIPRGRALGMVQYLPERDEISQSFKQMKAGLAMAMGGRVAEEVFFGADNVTSGAQGDIQMATRTARAMVREWGFSDELGKVNYLAGMNENPYVNSVSPEAARKIDEEVRRLVEEGYDTARKIITENRDDLERIAQALLEYETLSGAELKDLLDGKQPHRDSDDDTKPSKGSGIPSAGVKSSVPPAGKRDGCDDVSGLEPQPE